MPNDQNHQRDALSLIRAHTTATLLADASPAAVRYITDRADGSIALRLDARALDADELLLCLPDDSFDGQCARLLVTPAGQPTPVTADRHMAYHPRHQGGTLARLTIEFAKLTTGGVADGHTLMLASPLAAAEPRLCKRLNADRDALRDAVEKLVGVQIKEPLCVGVDPEGLDIRAAHGVVRAPLPHPCPDEQTCTQLLDTLLGGTAS